MVGAVAELKGELAEDWVTMVPENFTDDTGEQWSQSRIANHNNRKLMGLQLARDYLTES